MATTAGKPQRSKAGSAGGLDWLYRPEVRQVIYQVVIAAAITSFFWYVISNTVTNLRKQGIASGFGFWNTTAGFDISQTLVEYSNTMHYGRAIIVGLLNTLLVAVIGIFFATILGFLIGIARLSSNWLVARVATVYVEVVRNIPLLLQLFIWYIGVLKSVPDIFKTDAAGAYITTADGRRVPGSLELGGGILLNRRGLILPAPEWQPGSSMALYALILGIVAACAIAFWARQRQRRTGQQFPVLWTSLGLIIAMPVAVFMAIGAPVKFDYPTLGRFNLSGGWTILPELVALLLGLVIYTAAFIAEIVRAGILGVPKGQKEASRALGLSSGQMLRLVVLPQAMRIIIPPLTSNYLNLTKNSSLAVAIAYQDIVSVLAGTVLNQTNQAVETIFLTMVVYLTISLITSGLMNWFNARMALVER